MTSVVARALVHPVLDGAEVSRWNLRRSVRHPTDVAHRPAQHTNDETLGSAPRDRRRTVIAAPENVRRRAEEQIVRAAMTGCATLTIEDRPQIVSKGDDFRSDFEGKTVRSARAFGESDISVQGAVGNEHRDFFVVPGQDGPIHAARSTESDSA